MHDDRNSDNVWQWLVETGEQRVSQLASDVFSSPHLADAMAAAARGAEETRGQVNRNLEWLLSTLNVVTRSDHDALVRKVQELQGSLVNISMKLDRLLASTDSARREAPHRSPQRSTSERN